MPRLRSHPSPGLFSDLNSIPTHNLFTLTLFLFNDPRLKPWVFPDAVCILQSGVPNIASGMRKQLGDAYAVICQVSGVWMDVDVVLTKRCCEVATSLFLWHLLIDRSKIYLFFSSDCLKKANDEGKGYFDV